MVKEFSGHPCVQLENGAYSLEILDNFYPDEDLPKIKFIKDWQKKFNKAIYSVAGDHKIEDEDIQKHNTEEEFEKDTTISEYKRKLIKTTFPSRDDYTKVMKHIEYVDNTIKQYRNRGWFQKIKDKFLKRDKDIDELFHQLKQDMIKYGLKDVDLIGASIYYDEKIIKARLMGQKYLVEKFQINKDVIMQELELVKNGFNTFIKEEDIIKFMENSDRGVRIDFLNHYTGSIPDNVVDKKIAADNLYVFDNYCVLYYCDGVPTFRATQEEKEKIKKAKDPILFGMIRGSRRLYYVGDWISENDDLTLNKFYDVTGISNTEREVAEQKDLIRATDEMINGIDQFHLN